jgi:hypothetical protein
LNKASATETLENRLWADQFRANTGLRSRKTLLHQTHKLDGRLLAATLHQLLAS